MTEKPTKRIGNKAAYLPAFLAGISIFLAGIVLIQMAQKATLDAQRNRVLRESSVVRAKLEGAILANANLVRGLTASIITEPDMDQDRFVQLASHLFKDGDLLRNIAAAPNFVISMMYPVKGNEKAIGMNYRDMKGQAAAAEKAKQTRQLVLAGPMDLVQGGRGLIGRIPVYIPTPNADASQPDERFWGLVAAVIDVDKLYEQVGMNNPNSLIRLAMRGKDSTGPSGPVFYGDELIFEDNPVLTRVRLPYGSWEMAAIPANGWHVPLANQIAMWAGLLLIELLVLIPLLKNAHLLNERQSIIQDLEESKARLQDQANSLTELAKREIILRANAEKGEKTKAEFLATMSHEIRTPMTAVRGYADLLMDDPLPPESHARVQRIQEASNSLLVIINDILDLSKLEAGRLKLEQLSVDVRDLITESLAICGQAAHYDRFNTVGLSYQISGSVPARIMADPTRLRQVLINLIGNALKFTHNGRVKVLCEMHGPLLRIAVQDTGIGIEPEVIPNLFADFTQADASINRRYHGTGLGLAICKRLVSLMEGQIGVHSEVGKGSEFWFEIPCVRDEQQPAQTEVPTATLSHEANQGVAKPLHILVAEDNEMNRKIIGHLLDRLGYTYTLAENGQEAVDRVSAEDFDLILMDIRMPVLSGLDATRLIRQMPGRNRNIPILAVSADTLEE
ncbi:ATP-binding protein [Limnobacter litoralis]|uniref:histidine kinase n=1 Tax=Limnobacter litoralis TaxID=481366 RepID=A0ABQ5YQZ0_9BURK|nr:ATP-binding protein [Limnobacter litoralis]GLR27033.1 hypothetical protein GCM10007875_21240 [Limnobacter litoralis]